MVKSVDHTHTVHDEVTFDDLGNLQVEWTWKWVESFWQHVRQAKGELHKKDNVRWWSHDSAPWSQDPRSSLVLVTACDNHVDKADMLQVSYFGCWPSSSETPSWTVVHCHPQPTRRQITPQPLTWSNVLRIYFNPSLLFGIYPNRGWTGIDSPYGVLVIKRVTVA